LIPTKSIDVLLHVIKEVVAELHPSWPKTGKILPESLLTQDLGLDSLARVELLTRVERSFGVTLEEKYLSMRKHLGISGRQLSRPVLP